MRLLITPLLWIATVLSAVAGTRDAVFPNIDGGTLKLDDWAGQPALVVNTASECGFTRQYDGLQKLYERYRVLGWTCRWQTSLL